MSDGLVWLLVGAVIPLVLYTVVPGSHKPNVLILVALGVAGAVIGGPLVEMIRPDNDLQNITGIVGAGLGSILFTIAYRLVSDVLDNPAPQQSSPLARTSHDGTTTRRTRTI